MSTIAKARRWGWVGLLVAALVPIVAMGQPRDPDVNDDGIVNILDISLVGSCLGRDPAVEPRCAPTDVDGDGAITMDDLRAVVAQFGQTGFPTGEDDTTPPEVAITAPAPASFFGASPITVSGTTSGDTTSLAVNGIAATVGGGQWSAQVPLVEGNNVLSAVASDAAGNVGTASIQVTLDTAPPRVTIRSPAAGFVTSDESVTVAGLINDIVVGTVNGGQAQVSVNGVPAQVANRSYLVADVPLALGANTLVATGTDRAGNTASASVVVTRESAMNAANIRRVSGNNQTAPVGTMLPQMLVVELQDGAGQPVAGETVIFKVVQNNGTLSGSPSEVPSLALSSDTQGRAAASWRLGMRAGAGNNVVEATAVGFAGKVTFTATALNGKPAKISVDTGNNQVGVAGKPLPRPFVAAVTDAGHNRLPGVPVTFTVVRGGGRFANGQASITVPTDSDGRALAVLTLGAQEGFDNNQVEASFPDCPTAPAVFVASGKVAGDPANTSVSGVVLDNTNLPVPGVTMSIPGTSLTTQSDEQGLFSLKPAPVGKIHLVADGATAQRPGTWPKLEYELVTIAGRDNTIGMPVFLLPLDLPNALLVDETRGGTLTLPSVPGFSLTVAPGTATFPGGSRSGLVSVTMVHADKVPMTPAFGQQPRFIITIQPAGVLFEPPAPITIPNMDGLAPREVTELYSFDHDLGTFVSIGTGTVSADGSEIVSDPGVGIIKGGWHCGGNPAGIGTCEHECDDGNDCTEDKLVNGKCEHKNVANGAACRSAKQSSSCAGGKVNIKIADSCRGKCKDGACNDDPFGVKSMQTSLCSAIDKVFSACVKGDLAKTMREKLEKDGFNVTCDATSNLCGSAAPGSNTMTLTKNALDAAKCDALDSSTLHEMVHAVGGAKHRKCDNDGKVLGEVSCFGTEPNGCKTCIDPDTDKSYGCEAACFPTTGSKLGKAEACK